MLRSVNCALVAIALLLCLHPLVEALPKKLLTDRQGKLYSYFAVSSTASNFTALLSSNETFPYAFTEEMNKMVAAQLTGDPMLQLVGSVAGSIPTNLTSCKAGLNDSSEFFTSGCVKSLLNIGIPKDCPYVNTLCCVLYWQVPGTMPSDLPLVDVDPELILWDGQRGVNGYYNNFSKAYLEENSHCDDRSMMPPLTVNLNAGRAVAIDKTGEWRFTRRNTPMLTLLEVEVSATAASATGSNAINSNATSLMNSVNLSGKKLLVGKFTLPIPAAVCGALFLIATLVLVLLYFCSYRPLVSEVENMEEKARVLEWQNQQMVDTFSQKSSESGNMSFTSRTSSMRSEADNNSCRTQPAAGNVDSALKPRESSRASSILSNQHSQRQSIRSNRNSPNTSKQTGQPSTSEQEQQQQPRLSQHGALQQRTRSDTSLRSGGYQGNDVEQQSYENPLAQRSSFRR